MLKGFKDFLLRGNVIDLAVAVVVGAAFSQVVNAFAKDVIGSLLKKFGGDSLKTFDGLTVGGIVIGSTITALINFLIVASVIYFLIVVPVNRLAALRHTPAQEEEAAVPGADVVLLTEIRDLLAERRGV